jgi:hypothetical protein
LADSQPYGKRQFVTLITEALALSLNVRAGSVDEFKAAIPSYEKFVAGLAEDSVDLIIVSGTPPFMLLGRDSEAALLREWEEKYRTPIVSDAQMQCNGMRAMGTGRFSQALNPAQKGTQHPRISPTVPFLEKIGAAAESANSCWRSHRKPKD